jgi:hypothetical protein
MGNNAQIFLIAPALALFQYIPWPKRDKKVSKYEADRVYPVVRQVIFGLLWTPFASIVLVAITGETFVGEWISCLAYLVTSIFLDGTIILGVSAMVVWALRKLIGKFGPIYFFLDEKKFCYFSKDDLITHLQKMRKVTFSDEQALFLVQNQTGYSLDMNPIGFPPIEYQAGKTPEPGKFNLRMSPFAPETGVIIDDKGVNHSIYIPPEAKIKNDKLIIPKKFCKIGFENCTPFIITLDELENKISHLSSYPMGDTPIPLMVELKKGIKIPRVKSVKIVPKNTTTNNFEPTNTGHESTLDDSGVNMRDVTDWPTLKKRRKTIIS